MRYLHRYNILLALLLLLLIPIVTVQAQGITVTTQVQATLRSGPSRDFAPLGGVAPNVTVPALGRSADNTWVQVNSSGTVGWLSKIQVTVNGNFNALPVTGGQGSAAPAGVGTAPTKVPPTPVKVTTRTLKITERQVYLQLSLTYLLTSVSIKNGQLITVGKGTLDGVPKVFTHLLRVSVVNGKLAASITDIIYDGLQFTVTDFLPEGVNKYNAVVTTALNNLFVYSVGRRTIVGVEMNVGYMVVTYNR